MTEQENNEDVREPKYIYLRDECNFPAGCLAYSYNKEDGKVRYGYSIGS